MNILIKNADFSEVSIGQAGVVNASSLLTNLFFQDDLIKYISGKNKLLCYDVSGMGGGIVKITGYKGIQPTFAIFYPGNAITEDTSYTAEDISSLNDHFGTPLKILEGEQSGMNTVVVNVPIGAKSLCIYAASKSEGNCSLVEVLQ